MVRCSRLAEAVHRARFAQSLLRAARGKRREPARDPRMGRLEPERSPDGRALYARCRPEGALPQHRREGGGMSAAIRDLNDAFRRSLTGGRFTMTAGVAALPGDRLSRLVDTVRNFADFNADNDPHAEHDFGAVEIEGARFFWKIDLYEDPEVKGADGQPTTTRVLTIMLAEEW